MNNACLANATDKEIELRDQGFTWPKILSSTNMKRLRGRNKRTSRHTPTRVTSSPTLEYLTRCQLFEESKKPFLIHTTHPQMPSGLATTSPKISVLALNSRNHNDLFRLGLRLTRKTLKYFSQFYKSVLTY